MQVIAQAGEPWSPASFSAAPFTPRANKWAPALKESRWTKVYSALECNMSYLVVIKFCVKRSFDRVSPALFLIQYYSVL